MSMLEINGTGYAEKELERNWAAEYARREIARLENQKKDRLEANREHEGLTEMINTGLLGKKDKAEANREHDALAQQTNMLGEDIIDLSETKADKTQYASIDQAGLIKLYSSGGTNRSGLIVGSDGTTYVACSTNGGITRDGAGGLKITDGGVTSSRIGNGAVVTQKIADGAVTSEKLDKSLQTFKVTTDGNLMIPDGFSKSIAYSSVKVNKILGQALHDSDAIHHSLYDHAPSISESGATGDLWFVGDEHAVDEIYICGGIMPGEELQPGELGIQIDYFYWYKIYPHPDISDKADKTQYASINQAGLIKLYSGSGVNRSGLVVGEDGTTYVACKVDGGIARDGAGALKIVDGGVKTAMLADKAITHDKLGENAVQANNLADLSVQMDHLSEEVLGHVIPWDVNLSVFCDNERYKIPSEALMMLRCDELYSDTYTYDGASYQRILYNDEVGYLVKGTNLKKGNSYLCKVTKEPITGADPEDGILTVYAELYSDITDKADKQTATGGFIAGNNAASTGSDGGVAIGKNAKVIDSGTGNKGAALGEGATAGSGGSVGSYANTSRGGAVGDGANAVNGAAVGQGAKTTDGFAGGKNARCTADGVHFIDAVQLGSGDNPNEKTLQVYEYQLMDKNGKIPSERLPRDVMQNYSAAPQRIGTWIDGAPIWRVVVQQTITDEDRSDGGIIPDLPIKNISNVVIINEYMRLICSDDCAVDDIGLSPLRGCSYDISKWASNSNYDKISGWIEFATPESNIKTDTTAVSYDAASESLSVSGASYDAANEELTIPGAAAQSGNMTI